MDDPTPKLPSPDAIAARTATALRELQVHAQSISSTRRERLSHLEAELTKRLDEIADAVAEQHAAESNLSIEAAQAQEEIASLRERLEEQEQTLDERGETLAALEQKLKKQEAALYEQSAELAKREETLASRQIELDARQEEFDSSTTAQEAKREADHREAALQEQLAALQLERDELTSQLAALQQADQAFEKRAAMEQARLVELELELAERKAGEETLKFEFASVRVSLENERDQLRAECFAAQESLETNREAPAPDAELDELRQKFALALEDVQRFRTRVAALEQELDQRPEAGQADSSELVSLRAERDALAEKVATLEGDVTAPASGVDEQQRADMQRRFELAVEDVRELKTKNSRLELQLVAARKQAPGHTDAGGMDWESQKKRLLASLEGTDGGLEIEVQDRITIESTMQITDAVVAEKDQQISELMAKLAAKVEAPSTTDDARELAVKDLLDADEVIAEHRKRAAQMEHELEAKQRTLEMEMSVDRARIARQKVELDQLRISLETERNALGGGVASSGGGPKRRWLSKLGLSGDENE